ncbi:MAG: class B sortase [Lachnospiraceae bacterium]|nr:class B sortase [Lachnospiraceae bacterium]
MYHSNFSKETIWAVSIIILCILAASFQLFKIKSKTSDMLLHSTSANSIEIQEELPGLQDSAASTIDSADKNTTTTTLGAPIIHDVFADYESPIDFESLWEINKDVYAWITIPGTIIDYPILQHETDDSYYLNHTIEGVEGFPGCIYTERKNSKDFTDNNTVIYGHNLRNGKMFTELHKFRDENFFSQNDIIYIYTPTKQLTYKIFAAYLYDDRHLMNSFDFSDSKVYAKYLTEIQNMNSVDVNLRKEIKITDTDKIITLITCIREQPEKRVYVQGVLQLNE